MNINTLDLVYAALNLLGIATIVMVSHHSLLKKWLKGESSRKFVHIITATVAATWAFYLPQELIVAMALVLTGGVIILTKLGILKSIYNVDRHTYGQLSFGLAIAVSALLFANTPGVYALALINLGFADGLAALIGKRYAKRNFDVFGAHKSVIGSYACFLFAVLSGAIFLLYSQIVATELVAVIYIVFAASLITLLELIGKKGLDNILIPVVTGIMFSGIL